MQTMTPIITVTLFSELKQILFQEVVLVMKQIQSKAKDVFSPQDLVVWRARSEQRSLPVPAVVVRQEANSVRIRAYMEGRIQELDVNPDELVDR